jgi:hypothetical protein
MHQKLHTLCHRVLPRAYHTSHFAYFGAAAAGMHEVYMVIAGAIAAILIAAYIFSVDLV